MRLFDELVDGVRSRALQAYHGGPLAIDATDPFAGTVVPASGFGRSGTSTTVRCRRRRWIITRSDVLAPEPLGYKLRAQSFERWQDAVPDCL